MKKEIPEEIMCKAISDECISEGIVALISESPFLKEIPFSSYLYYLDIVACPKDVFQKGFINININNEVYKIPSTDKYNLDLILENDYTKEVADNIIQSNVKINIYWKFLSKAEEICLNKNDAAIVEKVKYAPRCNFFILKKKKYCQNRTWHESRKCWRHH